MSAQIRGRSVILLLVAVMGLAGRAAADPAADAQALFQDGEALKAKGDKAGALAKYEAALAKDGALTVALDAAAPLWLEKKSYDEAIAHFKLGVTQQPTYAMGWYWLAYAYRKTERYAPAVEAYQKFAELRPTEPDPYFGMGLSLEALGKKKDALIALKEYVSREKRPSEQKWVDKAKVEIGVLEKDVAVMSMPTPAPKPAELKPAPVVKPTPVVKPAPVVAPVVKPAPVVAPPVVKPAPVVAPPVVKPAPVVAPPVVKPAPVVAPVVKPAPVVAPLPTPAPTIPSVATVPTLAAVRTGAAQLKLGDAALAARKWGEAETAYRAALASDPTSLEASYRIGVALAAAGKLDDAVRAWEASLLLAPKDIRTREAIERTRVTAEKRSPVPPQPSAAQVELARGHLEGHRYVLARGLLDALLATPPKDLAPADLGEAYSLRAQARLALHDTRGAIDDYLRAIAAAPGRAALYRLAGEAYARGSDKESHDKAIFYLGLYVRRADGDPGEADNLAGVRRQLESLKRLP